MRRKNSKRTLPWGKLLAVSTIMIGAATLAQAHDDDKDRGPTTTQNFDLTGFDAIDISGVYDAEILVGNDYSIRLEGSEKDMEHARVELDGKTLELGKVNGKSRWNNGHTIEAYITLPKLAALDVSGVTDALVTGVDSENFELDVSGVADVIIDGSCGALEADISGVSDIEAADFKCKSADVDMSGVGDITVFASESIDADVSGVGDVVVYGSPKNIEKSVSKYTASLTIK
ncbi:MAG: hypothetical protein HKN36_02670 [Hellea sp.]|nr:hypothetical protein [Hellea sp.]